MPNKVPTTEAVEKPPVKRRKYRRWLVLLLILIAGAFWFNGPGWRWLLPMFGSRYIEKSGFVGTYRLEGTITGGLVIRDLDMKSEGTLARITVDRIEPVYRFNDFLRRREIKALNVDGLHADLRLGIEDEKDKPPLDLAKITEKIRQLRGPLLPLKLDFRNLTLDAKRDGESVITMAPSSISHAGGADEIHISLGELKLAGDRTLPAQEVEISWLQEDLAIDQIQLLPGLSVEKIALSLPIAGPSAEAKIIVGDAVFQLTSGSNLENLTLDLREGSIDSTRISEISGIELPAYARLTSFSLEAANVFPNPALATAKLQLLLDDIAWRDIAAPELALDFTLAEASANISARSIIHGAEIAMESSSKIDRKAGFFNIGQTTGTYSVTEITPLVRHFASKAEAMDPAAAFPSASANGTFQVEMARNRPQSAMATLAIKPADSEVISNLTLDAEWPGNERIIVVLEGDGFLLDAEYRTDISTYQGYLTLKEFNSARITPWLEIAKVKPLFSLTSTAEWKGGGDFKNGTHHGKLRIDSATATESEKSDILARGGIDYDWPGNGEARNLRLESGGQILTLNAKMADGLLDIKDFLLLDGETELIKGSGQFPVPENFSKWRDTLANDTRPMTLEIESLELPLSRLKTWLPAVSQIDERATGRVKINLSGNFANPEVDIAIAFKDLRSPLQPKLPPADLELKIAGRDGRLTVDGIATAPDFPAAKMTASMGFHPVKWAKEPGLVLNESITALIDLPRLDVSRFASLVPVASKLRGTLTGKVNVAGTLGKPEPKGELNLTGAGLLFVKEKFPEINGVDVKVDLNLETISIRSIRAVMAGGTLAGEGSYTIANKTFDVRLRGDHLPVIRNEMLILRANADLRLQGLLEKAVLSGTVGVVDSIYFRDIEILPIGSPFTSPKAASLPKIDAASVSPTAGIPAPFSNWTLNVTLRTEEPFLIRGNLATGRVDGSVKINGTLGNPAPSGKVMLSKARASLPFSTLSVTQGTLHYSPASGFDPVLEFRGTSEPRPYRVDFYVYGRASDPQLVLTSNPPLPENEIMTLLATGTTTRGLEDPQAASSRALQLFAEEIRRGRFPFSNRLRPILGLLDRVDFSLSEADPYSNDSFSTATLKLHDRWYVSAGMGSEGDTRVLGIWRLRFR